MKIRTIAAALIVGGIAAAPVYAQETPAPAPAPEPEKKDNSGFYAGAGINLYFLDRDYAGSGMGIAFEDQPSPGAFMGRLGYAFNDNIAVEVEAGIGGARSKFSVTGYNVDGEIGIKTPLGAHVVLSAPLGEAYVMAKLGYVSATISREIGSYTPDDLDFSGASYGIGGGIRNGPWDYRMEYSFVSGGDSGDGGVLGIFALHHF
jgi:opacity protein-like surface antigen